jgi:hypothetical protein
VITPAEEASQGLSGIAALAVPSAALVGRAPVSRLSGGAGPKPRAKARIRSSPESEMAPGSG